MAVEWIKWVKGLTSKREVAVIAAVLKLDRFSVAGRLMAFWEWCDENIKDEEVIRDCGSAVTVLSPSRSDNESLIDSIAGIQGFALAMERVGWLRFMDDGIEVPNFGRHNGETAKSRAMKTLAQKRRRSEASSEAQMKPSVKPSEGVKRATSNASEKRKEKKENSGDVSPETPPGETPKPRPRDLLWDAIVDVTGVDSATAAPMIGKVKKALLEANPPFTPEEVRKFAAQMPLRFPWARGNLTLSFLQQNIGTVRQPLPKEQGAQRGKAPLPSMYYDPERDDRPVDHGPPVDDAFSGQAP